MSLINFLKVIEIEIKARNKGEKDGIKKENNQTS